MADEIDNAEIFHIPVMSCQCPVCGEYKAVENFTVDYSGVLVCNPCGGKEELIL